MSGQDNALEVWLECDLGPPCRVGTLAHDRGQIRFQYEQAWLRDARAFAIDPDLSLDKAPFFPKPELGNFGIFLDSSPDRWGQTLMKRREALQAKDEKRPPRTLYTWDFLLGVQDFTRQGGLRFRRVGTLEFMGNEKMAAPPVTTLRELEAVAYQLSNRRIDDLEALRKWLAVLVAPGASLGGARPKTNFTDADGSLWIGKFPARNDDRDVGAWEHVVHGLAQKAGVDVPEAKVVRLSNEFHTFCVQRFDRAKGTRRFYASAMTLLRKEQSEGTSYLELAQLLRTRGDGAHTSADLEQLFRRYPLLERRFLDLCTRELAQSQEHIMALGRFTAEERVAGFLLSLMEAQRRRSHRGPVFDLPATRADIGEFLGLTLETVSRAISSFRRRDLIRLHGQSGFEILNEAALIALGTGEGEDAA